MRRETRGRWRVVAAAVAVAGAIACASTPEPLPAAMGPSEHNWYWNDYGDVAAWGVGGFGDWWTMPVYGGVYDGPADPGDWFYDTLVPLQGPDVFDFS